MGVYQVKSLPSQPTLLHVLRESDGGFFVRITRTVQDYTRQSEEFISKQLFESCLRTGYFTEAHSA